MQSVNAAPDNLIPEYEKLMMRDGMMNAALWSSTYYGNPENGCELNSDDDDERIGRDLSFDDWYSPDDFSVKIKVRFMELLNEFLSNCIIPDIAEYRALFGYDTSRPEKVRECNERIGHDLWLTMNRHGAGFWDRDLQKTGERLTDAAHLAGEKYVYIGDDKLLWIE